MKCICEVFGETWAAPITSITAENIRGTVEKEIAEKEYALKKAKANKKRGTPADETRPGDSVIEVDDVWSIPSDGEAPSLAVKGKAAKSSAERDAATAARKAAREKESSWKKEIQKATRVIQSLTSVMTSLKSMTAKVEKNPAMVNAELTKGLQEATEKLSEYKKSASAISLLYIYIRTTSDTRFSMHFQNIHALRSGVTAQEIDRDMYIYIDIHVNGMFSM